MSTIFAATPYTSLPTTKAPSSDKWVYQNTGLVSPDMHRENHRIKTFVNWPVNFLSAAQLAKNGFYYLGRGDEVRCAFCNLEISKWVEGDDPALDHQKWAPHCPLISKLDIPIHLRYASQAARARSFNNWPRNVPQKPKDLASAGFFYTGQDDKTKCFHCDLGLKDWENSDVPWEQHVRWNPNCSYVQKGMSKL